MALAPFVPSDRDIELLRDLACFRRLDDTYEGWARPMDIGARDASWHSGVLKRLCKYNLVERRRRYTIMNDLGSRRGSYRYRITDAGLAAIPVKTT